MQAPHTRSTGSSGGEVVLSYGGAISEWADRATRDLRRIAGSGAKVVVDLREVESIDSLLLSALVLAKTRLRMNGGDLSLVCDRPEVLRHLRRTGLDRALALRALPS